MLYLTNELELLFFKISECMQKKMFEKIILTISFPSIMAYDHIHINIMQLIIHIKYCLFLTFTNFRIKLI